MNVVIVLRRAGLFQRGFQGAHERFIKSVGVIAPGLIDGVTDQCIADDAARKRMAVGGFLPFAIEVPVIGDIVIVEDHRNRYMRKQPADFVQLQSEALYDDKLSLIKLRVLVCQIRWRAQVQARATARATTPIDTWPALPPALSDDCAHSRL